MMYPLLKLCQENWIEYLFVEDENDVVGYYQKS